MGGFFFVTGHGVIGLGGDGPPGFCSERAENIACPPMRCQYGMGDFFIWFRNRAGRQLRQRLRLGDGDHVRFVNRANIRDIGKDRQEGFDVTREAIYCTFGAPPSLIGEPSRVREVMKRNKRHHTTFQARLDHVPVMQEVGARNMSLFRLDSCPFDAKPV